MGPFTANDGYLLQTNHLECVSGMPIDRSNSNSHYFNITSHKYCKRMLKCQNRQCHTIGRTEINKPRKAPIAIYQFRLVMSMHKA